MAKSIEDWLSDFEKRCEGLPAGEVAQAKVLLAEVLQMPAAKLRQVVRVLHQAEAVRAAGGDVEAFWCGLGVNVPEVER